MKKEDVIALGVTEEQATSILKLYTDSLDGNYVTKARFNEINEENKQLKAQISDRDTQLETLKKVSGDSETLKKQIEELQEQNAAAQKEHEAEITKLKLDNAVESALSAAGARNSKAVRSLFDETTFKLNDKGEVEGLSDAIKAVQKSDPYLFETGNQTQVFKGYQPGSSSAQKPGTKVDTSKMSYDELCAYLEQNPGVSLE